MLRPGALAMTVVMVGVAGGVYFGLDYVPRDVIPKFLQNPQANAPAETPAPAEAPAEVVARPLTSPEGEAAPAADAAQTAEVAAAAPAEASPEPAAEPAAEAQAQPEPQAAAPVEPAPTPAEPAPAPAPKKKAAAAAPTPAPSTASTEAEPPPRPIGNRQPQADAIKQWWPDPASMPDNQLKLVYAGQVQGEKAIALLFSAPLKPETIKLNIQLRTLDGRPVQGEWEIGKTPKMAIFRNVPPGRYTVILAPRIEDTNGFILGTVLRGPVYIKGS